MKDEAVEALIREGVRRERARVVEMLQREARGLSPLVRALLLDIARNVEAGEPFPEEDS